MENYIELRSGTLMDGIYSATIYNPTARQSASVVVTPALIASTALGNVMKGATVALDGLTLRLSARIEMLNAKSFFDWSPLDTETFKPLGNEYSKIVKAAIDRRNELIDAMSDWSTFRPSDEYKGGPNRPELRNRLASMKPAASLALALQNDDTADAVSEGGEAIAQTLGWTPDMWARFIVDYAERNLANRLTVQYRLQPNATDPLRSGYDRETARRVAKEHIATNRRDLAEIDAVVPVLTGMVDFVAVAMGRDRSDAFNVLTGA